MAGGKRWQHTRVHQCTGMATFPLSNDVDDMTTRVTKTLEDWLPPRLTEDSGRLKMTD